MTKKLGTDPGGEVPTFSSKAYWGLRELSVPTTIGLPALFLAPSARFEGTGKT